MPREIVRRVHEQGHFGIMRTQMSLSDRFYWPLWRSDVKKCVGKCHECNMRKGPHERVRLPERKFLTSEVSERIAVDICGPFPETQRGNKYMLVITDFFSKWVEPLAIKISQLQQSHRRLLMSTFVVLVCLPRFIQTMERNLRRIW
jgi:hypothetical protein